MNTNGANTTNALSQRQDTPTRASGQTGARATLNDFLVLVQHPDFICPPPAGFRAPPRPEPGPGQYRDYR